MKIILTKSEVIQAVLGTLDVHVSPEDVINEAREIENETDNWDVLEIEYD
jgi:hypothetical protein